MTRSSLSTYLSRLRSDGPFSDVLRISFSVGVITLLAKFLFVVRDIIVAWTFGRSQPLEAFILAFLIPYSFTNALSNALTMTFLPYFIELRGTGQKELANDIYTDLLGISIAVSAFAMLLLILGYSIYSPIVAASFSVEGFSLMQFLIYFTAPAALLNGIANIWKEILNAKEMFLRSSLVSTITPLISIILLTSFTNLGVLVLAIGLLAGVILELFLLGVFLKKRKFRLLPGFGFFTLHLKLPLKEWWRAFVSLSLFNSMSLINSSMAARRSEIGGLSMLNYGKKIVTLPNDIGAVTFSSVLIPYLSNLMVSKDPDYTLKVINRWLLFIFAATIPVVITFLYSSEKIVGLLYERGAFTVDDTKTVSIILGYYIIQLPFFVAFFVMLRILPVIKKNDFTLLFGVLGVILTVTFNYAFISMFGTKGIALATSCVYACLSIGAYGYIRGTLSASSNGHGTNPES